MKEGSRKRVGKKAPRRAGSQVRPMARAIGQLFGAQAEGLAPVVGVLLDTKQTIDEVLAEGGRARVELLLRISAAQLAG